MIFISYISSESSDWHELSIILKSIWYDIVYLLGWKKKGRVKNEKKKILDSQIGGDTKLSISMQSMDQIQFGEIVNSNPFPSGAPYQALWP